MKKLALIFLTATMALGTFGSGAALAAGSSSNNGMSNQSDGPGAKENLPPNNVDNSQINTGSNDVSGNTSIDTGTGDTSTATGTTDADEAHKKTMCKDGRCPDQTPGAAADDTTK
ncbi:protein YbgS [Nissabacter sp. SGAir0207]|uniref:protein YbgS n=1 Tax=Nissabacter sp. SGAir0207 TaxID=2126321 RepID=UPI0010CCDA2B|nr:protein YbgS [Nissabacter sp. SGAir0207]QCR36722.1 hypothetical protein C1N62_11760 [Nissabacter sp. SGAir0207]